MICPVCGHNNLQGADECGNCGTDLRTVDIPHPGDSFERRLVTQPLATVRGSAPLTVPADIPVVEVIARMRESSTGCVVVEEDGRVAGIFTERDALLKLAGRPLDGVRIASVMTRDPVVLRADDSIAVAIHKMAVGGFRHIPLVENGHATGMVSAGDIFRYILEVVG